MVDTDKFDINAIIETAKSVITGPVAFYRSMPKAGGLTDPIIFLVAMSVATGLVTMVFAFFGAGVAGGIAAGLAAIILVPVFALIGSFIGAAILFVIWKVMDSEHSYETSYRCVAYASAIYPIVTVLKLFPYLGTIIGVAWGVFLMYTASIEVHAIKQKTASIVFGVLGVILLFWNVSAEYTARAFQAKIERFGDSMQDWENMNPEEAGEKMGEFLKGLEKAMEEEGN